MVDIRVGLDMTEIARIQKSMEDHDRFAERILGERERAYYEEHGMKAESVAAAFCAKEAFSKALGTGVRGLLPVGGPGPARRPRPPLLLLLGQCPETGGRRRLDVSADTDPYGNHRCGSSRGVL